MKKPPVVAIIPNPATPTGYAQMFYFGSFISGVARYGRTRGPWRLYSPVLRGFEFALQRDPQAWIEQIRPGGLIVHDALSGLAGILKKRIPTILWSTVPDGSRQARRPYLVTDNASVGAMAAEHLIDRGFRHLAFCGFDEQYWSADRRTAFAGRAEAAGCDFHLYRQPRSKAMRLWPAEQQPLTAWIRELPKPAGIMACNDERAYHVVTACADAGIDVPQQVAVLGVDNDPLICELSYPQISSVRRDYEAAGYRAASVLARMMAGRKVAADMTIPIRPEGVVARQSTDVMAVDDPQVARALEYIRGRAGQTIQVRDVVKATSLPRCTLYKRFKKVMGRSIAAEIRRHRVAKIIRMLLETDLSISQIALEMEFSGVGNLVRYFAKEMHTSPGAYRRMHREG
jgi:LacI family transcriptional regulator